MSVNKCRPGRNLQSGGRQPVKKQQISAVWSTSTKKSAVVNVNGTFHDQLLFFTIQLTMKSAVDGNQKRSEVSGQRGPGGKVQWSQLTGKNCSGQRTPCCIVIMYPGSTQRQFFNQYWIYLISCQIIIYHYKKIQNRIESDLFHKSLV